MPILELKFMQTEKERAAFMRNLQYKAYGLLAIKLVVIGLLFFYLDNDPWMNWLLLAYLLFSLFRTFQMLKKGKSLMGE